MTPRRTEQSFQPNIGGHPNVKITTQIGYSRACATMVLTKVIAPGPVQRRLRAHRTTRDEIRRPFDLTVRADRA